MLPRNLRLLALVLVLACTAGCDQVTKHFARTELGGRPSVIFPGRVLELTLAENPGAFLSLGASLPGAVRNSLSLLTALGLTALLVYLLRIPQLPRLAFLGWSLVWAGGMSNLIDRLARHGLVTDFAIVRLGPLHTGVFNVADFAIVVGILLVFVSFQTASKPAAQAG